jgi:hypothetical protein
MSLTDAFRLLNSSIRGIRKEEMAHEERMMQAENDRAKLEAQANDPERLYKRQQYEQLMEPSNTKPFALFSTEGKSPHEIAEWEELLPKFRGMLPDDMDITNKGTFVKKGTETPYKQEAWKNKELHAQLNLAYATYNLKEKAMDREIGSYQERINNIDMAKKEWRQLPDSMKVKRGALKQKLNTLTEHKNDPKRHIKRLMSDNISASENLRMLFTLPNFNDKLAKQIQSYVDSNNNMLASYAKTQKGSGLVAHKYTLINKKGEKIVRDVYGHKDENMPETVQFADGTFKRGTISEAPGVSKKDLTETQENKVRKQYHTWTVMLEALDDEIKDQDILMDRMGITASTATKDQLDMIELIKKDSKKARETLNTQIKDYENRYGGKLSSIPGRDEKIKNTLGLSKRGGK